MITREQVMEYFRSEAMEELGGYDRYEIMVACCSHSDFLEELVNVAIEKEEKRLISEV